MEVATPNERHHHQHPVSVGSATSLPSIAHLTCTIPQQQQQQQQQQKPQHELSPIHGRQHRLSHQQQLQQQQQQQQQQMELRDSGNWSLTQSKRKSSHL